MIFTITKTPPMEKKHIDDQPKATTDEENSTFSDQIPTTFPSIFDDIKNYSTSGFTDMLDIQDYSNTPSLFDMFQTPPPPPPTEMASTSGNSTNSISSSSTEVTNDTDLISTKTTAEDEHQQHEQDQDQEIKIKHELIIKPKKKNTKRIRQPRFAFMTKSDVDHLDDGYRWRKYGQKAVKNSPFPRSYYRCTTTSCGVKKRVERSSQDPSIVVTTYEGTHTHQCPVSQPRGGNINNINIGGPVVLPAHVHAHAHHQILASRSSSSGVVSPNNLFNINSQPYYNNINNNPNYQFYYNLHNHPLPILSNINPPLVPFDLSGNSNYISNPNTTTSTSNNYNPLLSDIFINQERFYYYPPNSTSSSSPSPSSSSSPSVRDSGLLQDMIMPSKAREVSKDDHD